MMTSLLFVTLSALAFSSVIAYNLKNNIEREMELKEIRRKSYPKRTFDHFEHITSATHTLSNLHSISCTGPQCNITAEVDGDSSQIVPLRLVFWGPNVVRYWLAIDGNFSDTGTMDDVIVGVPSNDLIASLTDAGNYYQITVSNSTTVVQLVKSPLTLTVLSSGRLVLQEAAPLSWNSTSSWQTLTRDTAPSAPSSPGLSAEYFFGGGMQNGRFSHRDQAITIGVDYNWDDGGHPNSVPWYVSSAGYGVFRNTWAPAVYTFANPVTTAHNESNRFDAFIMVADSIKSLLGLYTDLTGPPFLVPLYGLFLGDSDCYHNDRHGNSTQVAIAVAKLYNQYDIPHGWMLPNDGYGCGYGEGGESFPSNLTDLTYVVSQLHEQGMYTGLWTSTGMPNLPSEVGIAGTRVCKTDVGWIGDGYKFAFDGVSLCSLGIEEYSTPPSRRFTWTVEGWSGTHRLSVMWSGDDSGSMNYVRWQIPTFTGSGLSAQAHVSGDVDGIFGGSPESYVRDLQFKALTTTIMVMSGWAPNPDKQPWTWGEPFTSYNRAALKMKARLTPYIYSYCRFAYDTGVPPIRALLLEFPEDETLYSANNGSSYEFMSGEFLLAAPVYIEGATSRDGIYLPNGTKWIDWWNASIYEGGQTIDNYDAPLDKLPLFVKAGAIIPQWPDTNYFNQVNADPMYLELWPSGTSSFSLYEDDGVTRDALPPKSMFSTTAIQVVAPIDYLSGSTSDNVTISVDAAQGTFNGQLTSRGWWLNIRCKNPPLIVTLSGGGVDPMIIPMMQSESELEYNSFGWYHDDSLQTGVGGILMVKMSGLVSDQAFTVTLSNGPSYPHIGTEDCDTPSHHQVENQKFVYDSTSSKFFVEPVSSNLCLTIGQDNDPDSHTPALEVQACSSTLDDSQQFVIISSSNQIALKSDSSTCLDQDVSVNRVIKYSCHDQGSPGNQAWAVNPNATEHIASLANGLCMYVLASP
jgi:alpha-glucosidase